MNRNHKKKFQKVFRKTVYFPETFLVFLNKLIMPKLTRIKYKDNNLVKIQREIKEAYFSLVETYILKHIF